jgi:excisionase family DNA binding protein
MSSGPAKEWYTTKELALYLRIAYTTLEKWRSMGIGPPFHRIGRAIRYLLSEVIAWMK